MSLDCGRKPEYTEKSLKIGHFKCHLCCVCVFCGLLLCSLGDIKIDFCRISPFLLLTHCWFCLFGLCQGLLCWQCAVPIFPPSFLLLHVECVLFPCVLWFSFHCQFRVLILRPVWVAGPWWCRGLWYASVGIKQLGLIGFVSVCPFYMFTCLRFHTFRVVYLVTRSFVNFNSESQRLQFCSA